MKNLLCFDLDGTLTPSSTWEMFNAGIGISSDDDYRLFNSYKNSTITYDEWMQELVRLYKEKPPVTKPTIEAAAQSTPLRPDAQKAIADAKAKGYRVIILSGGIDVMVGALAEILGVTEWFTSNKAVFNDENELIDIHHGGDERNAKLLLLKNFCSHNNYELSDVIEVADGGNDTEVFKAAKGILLGNNAELAPLAWKQIQHLSELDALL